MKIADWEELSKIPSESKTHKLEIDVERGTGWLRAKVSKPYKKRLSFMRQIMNQDVYLSTHTFYAGECEHCTKVLKACGFNVELVCWEEE